MEKTVFFHFNQGWADGEVYIFHCTQMKGLGTCNSPTEGLDNGTSAGQRSPQ